MAVRSRSVRQSAGWFAARARRLLLSCALVLLAASVGCQVAAHLVGGRKLWIFTANFGDDSVSVVDGDLDREVKVIEVGRSPQALALRADPPLLAVANSDDRRVTLIDPVARERIEEPVLVGLGPEHVAFSIDGKTLFVTSYHEKTVSMIDVATRSPRAEPVAFSRRPRRLLPSPDGRRLYVLLHDEQGAVAAIDLPSGTAGLSAPVGRFPTAMVLTPDGSRLLAGSFDRQSVTVIDASTLNVIETLRLPVGNGLVLHPNRPLLYSFLSFDGEVLVFDLAKRQRVASVVVGESPLAGAIAPDGRFLYVVNEDSHTLVKFDTQSNTVVTRIAVGLNPNDAVVFSGRS